MGGTSGTIAYISLTTPAMLAGLGIVALPVIAHLMNRQARSRHVFPSLQLLQQVATEQSRIATLRRWLLLALRCLAIAAFVFAFCRPVWRTNPRAALVAERRNDVVFVIDQSASMHAMHNGVSRFENAKAETIRLLRSLRAGQDQAAVLLMGQRSTAVFPDFTANLAGLATEVQQLAGGYDRANPQAALALAKEFIDRAPGIPRLVIVSDLQASNWQPALDAEIQRLVPGRARVSIVDVGADTIQNVAVNLPRCTPQRPLQSQVVTFTAQLTNHSSHIKQVRVQAEIQGEQLPAKTVTLEPNQSQDVAFERALHEAGSVPAKLYIPDDEFEGDNAVSIVARAEQGIPVAILTDDDPGRMGSASYFLSLAMAPFGDRNDRFDLQRLAQRDTTASELRPHAAVFVGYLGQLETPAADGLVDYARNGGALIVFCGQGPVQRNLELLQRLSDGKLLPFDVGPRQTIDAFADPVQITSGRWRSPLLKDFHLASQVALRDVRFQSRWSVTTIDAGAEVLLSYQDGVPALATRSFGRGHCVLANFSPDAASSDIGKHGAFVALCQILAQNLSRDDMRPNSVMVGDTISLALPDLADSHAVSVQLPSGKRIEANVQTSGRLRRIIFDRTETPGLYGVMADDERVDVFAVNLDPVESDTNTVDPDELLVTLEGNTAANASAATRDSLGDPFELHGQPLWGWLLVAAFGFVALELVLLGRWGQ